ncbi:hypothetical protein [Vibrio brasiliensis]
MKPQAQATHFQLDIATLHNASIELLPRKDDRNEFTVRFSANQ